MQNKEVGIIKKGSVVLIPFPFTDQTGSKIRPGVVLGSSKNRDIIIAFVSSKSDVLKDDEVLILPTNSNGLKVKSKIICSKITTVDSKIIFGGIGVLSIEEIKIIDKKIKEILNL